MRTYDLIICDGSARGVSALPGERVVVDDVGLGQSIVEGSSRMSQGIGVLLHLAIAVWAPHQVRGIGGDVRGIGGEVWGIGEEVSVIGGGVRGAGAGVGKGVLGA